VRGRPANPCHARLLSMAYIEKRRNGYYAVVEVPPKLRSVVGHKRLRKTLATSDRATARARVWTVVAELKGTIEEARKATSGDPVTNEARAFRSALRKASPDDDEALREQIADRAYELRGSPKGDTIGVPPWEYSYDAKAEKQADEFYALATGKTTPVDEYLEQWLSETSYTPRTQVDHRRAVERLKARGGETLEAVTRRRAGEYISALIRTMTRKTAAKYKSSLSSYWKWLRGKGIVEANVWADQPIAKRKSHLEGTELRERSFTDEELLKLLDGAAEPLIADLVRMGALSGMRIGEMCRLKVRDCEGGLFAVRKAKTEAGIRKVPIHPDLRVIAVRRSRGKQPNVYLFDELKEPPPASPCERSMPAVKRFGRYMRSLGIAVILEGKRRSLVNFHSLRRYFITKAEQAGQPESIIASVVGHARQGMTLGGYSGGPSLAQLRACVEAVRLPRCGDGPHLEAAKGAGQKGKKGGPDHERKNGSTLVLGIYASKLPLVSPLVHHGSREGRATRKHYRRRRWAQAPGDDVGRLFEGLKRRAIQNVR
jgi:integrase